MTQLNEEINALLFERVAADNVSSAVYIVAENGEIVFEDALGYAVRVPEKILATVETIYDLASLTKPLIVGLLSAIFLERKLFALDDAIGKHLPEFEKAGKGHLTFRQLLTHTSGFPSWRPFYLLTDDKEKILATIAAINLEAEPNTTVKYSDLNFIALGIALERIAGLRLDELAKREIFKPLNLKNTFFNPPANIKTQIAANETGNAHERKTCKDEGYDDSNYVWREDVIWGEVHDNNSYFMGGVSGHAGLFSNAQETLKIALQFLPKHSQLLKLETCLLFRQNMCAGLAEDRSLAFQLASTKDSIASMELSPDSFGHLGFTGTSLWIDAERDRVFILLTNRTHDHPLPHVLINGTRRKFHSAASNALDQILNTQSEIVTESPKQKPDVPFKEAFRFWVKLGFISFGGPAGQIAIMHKELVEKRKWISEERFLHALNYCMLLPGPEAQQLATYIGWLLHKTIGGIVAGVFFVLPSIFVLLTLSYIYAAYGNVKWVAGVLTGFKPVVVAIVVEAVLKIGKRAIKRNTHFVIAALAFVAIYFLHIPFPLIVLAAGLIGLAGAKIFPALFTNENQNNEGQRTKDKGQSLPDDIPLHAKPSYARVLKVLLVCFLLWLLPFIVIVLKFGWASIYAQVYRFFSKAAFVTFGGAYAVLAYVNQAAVDSYNWITSVQSVDGLALAETTPGPLIMVLQFVGFMAGWNNEQGMSQTTSAVFAALITTFTTFLPSFLFIFIGAPYIEALRGKQSLNSALTGITAAVVGVVLNLAIVFGLTVIFPKGLSINLDWFALAMSIAAFVALVRYKADVLFVVLAGGLFGMLKVVLFG